MSALDLYEKYLHNSISFGSYADRNKRIIHEKEELLKIINSLNNVFYKDKDIVDKNNHSVYALVKKEMARKIVSAGNEFKPVFEYYQFYLREMLNRIMIAQVSQ